MTTIVGKKKSTKSVGGMSRRKIARREKQKKKAALELTRAMSGGITMGLARNLSPAGKAFDDIWAKGIIPQLDPQDRQSLRKVCGYFDAVIGRMNSKTTSMRLRDHYAAQVERADLPEDDPRRKLKACYLPSQRLSIPPTKLWYAISIKQVDFGPCPSVFRQFCKEVLDVDSEAPVVFRPFVKKIATLGRLEFSYVSRSKDLEMTLNHDPRYDYPTEGMKARKMKMAITGVRERVKEAEQWLCPTTKDEKGDEVKLPMREGIFVKGLCRGRREYK